ncbi:hypothetical protein J5N97_002054 [Dioscorea zingiberensis]|uniref:GDSL esterase/lipase n=1 Tax=Dioscorea zingiberensis TaxID=325984 RepID=A0A9D5BT00_9LILI|nr:hypothetical protein J5N97_002054 [Dioscorea zingiberensis]
MSLLASLLLTLFFIIIFISSSAPVQDRYIHIPSHFLVDAVIPATGDAGPSATPAPIAGPLPDLPSSPLAPALFVIGDSTVDCGTNNYLGTIARADRPPYGRDFDTHRPTGRFSNGRVIIDFLEWDSAERLGLPFVPPYLGRTGRIEDMIHGLNYASAASGILFSSGSDLGQHISLTQQIQQLMDTFQQLEMDLGVPTAADFISSFCLSPVMSVNGLKKLYDKNVRKVVLMGIAPMAAPHTTLCIMAVRMMKLNHELSEARIIFCDAFNGSMEILANRNLYGFQTTTEACCGLGKYRGFVMCLMPEMACSNASTYVWWDEFHPTDVVNRILANNVWSSEHSDMCHPMNLLEMIRLDH